MTVSEAIQAYRDEWVAMRVRRTNRYDVPVAGDVVVHAADRRAFDEQERVYRTAHRDERLFVFFAGEPIPEGLAVCLAQLSAEAPYDIVAAGFTATLAQSCRPRSPHRVQDFLRYLSARLQQIG